MYKMFAIIITLSACLASAQSADPWLKMKNLGSIKCESWGYGLYVVSFNGIRVVEIQGTREQAIVLRNLCEASRAQANQDASAVYLNLKTGETSPENGFFQRVSRK